MKEHRPQINHDGEPITEYSPGYEIWEFPYCDFDIRIKVADQFLNVAEPEVYIKIYRDDRDVTNDYMFMGDSPGFIRPTLPNLQQILSILDENMETEFEEAEIKDGETTTSED